ncbi:type VI secretion system contractile sheath large subunit [Methylomonas montana]|uniref:type VI secretion system contractile sheath domain-containing protein n=1 Tax=Methylomonas montana TaxID=3058963 RepID=UPI002658A712|nr:type VI secretion system contractile sheath large subunit [Methylomonas montana]WKJ91694.1 type VI secretion system contractile sheath large subunit [Methylomonas montana]
MIKRSSRASPDVNQKLAVAISTANSLACWRGLGLLLFDGKALIAQGVLMPGRIDFTMGFNPPKAAKRLDGDSHYRVYMLGHFSGHTDTPWEQRKIRKIDIDHFEQVQAQIMPTLEIAPGSTLQFAALDDFHPDVWLGKIKLLADLRSLKRELSNPDTAEHAAVRIQAYFPVMPAGDAAVQVPEATESQEDMLERLLGKKPESPVAADDSVDSLLKRMVAPHVAKDAAPQHQALIDLIDATLSQFVREVLHRPDFQKLEALWRAAAMLVNEEFADRHDIFLVDISQAELSAESKSGSQAFARKLLSHVQDNDDQADVLLVGDYGFTDSAGDKSLLIFCSQLAKTCGGHFLGGVEHALTAGLLAGDAETIQNWAEYRRETAADNLILAYPRYLLRLPYGAKRDPLEAFVFEECSLIPKPDELLWGNPAFLCAQALIRMANVGNVADPYFFNDIPAFTYPRDDEQILQPATESVLNEKQANFLLSQGIVPLICFRQRQGVRVLAGSSLS